MRHVFEAWVVIIATILFLSCRHTAIYCLGMVLGTFLYLWYKA
jgi:hypothetical protein